MAESLSTERTFFNAGTRIEGTLELDGEVKLEGQIKGKVSGTGVVIARSRGMRTSDTGAAKARSDTGSRRGAETANHTTNARNTERIFHPF